MCHGNTLKVFQTLFVLGAVVAGAAADARSSPACPLPYGAAPGSFNLRNDATQRWQAFQPECSLQPLLKLLFDHEQQVLAASPAAQSDVAHDVQSQPAWRSKPLSHYVSKDRPLVLLLGDSGDRFILLDFCVAARGLKGGGSSFVHLPRYPDLRGTGDENEPLHRYMYFQVCEGAAMSVAMRAIPGVHATGPWHKASILVGASSPNASWVERVPETLTLFSRFFGRAPDLVLVHSNYWDVARIAWQSPGPKKWLSVGMLPAWLTSYQQNLTALVTLITKQVPKDTLVMLRTAIPPNTDDQGVANSRQLGGRLPVAQINSAIRAVALQQGLPLIDCEMHVAGFTPKQMLRDSHHAAVWLNLEWLNMAVNELYSRRPSLFRHVKQQ